MNATTSTKSIEQLRKDAEETAKALREAEEQARQQERSAKQELERAQAKADAIVRYGKQLALLNPVVDAFRAAGFAKAKIAEPSEEDRGHPYRFPAVQPFGECTYGYDAVMEATHSSGSSWRQGPFKHYTLVVGRHDDKHRFPQLKSGGFNAKKIVALVQEMKDRAQRLADAQRQQLTEEQRADSLADRVRRELKATDDLIVGAYDTSHRDRQNRFRTTKNIAPKGKVFVRLGTMALTLEQARIVVEAVREARALDKKEAA